VERDGGVERVPVPVETLVFADDRKRWLAADVPAGMLARSIDPRCPSAALRKPLVACSISTRFALVCADDEWMTVLEPHT
jgi:hypothetical protein